MCPVLPDPANDDFRPAPEDAVARYFATRSLRRGVTAAASCLAAAILVFTIMHSVELSRQSTETVVSFRL